MHGRFWSILATFGQTMEDEDVGMLIFLFNISFSGGNHVDFSKPTRTALKCAQLAAARPGRRNWLVLVRVRTYDFGRPKYATHHEAH